MNYHNTRRGSALFAASLAAIACYGQATDQTEDEIFELSPFEVKSDDDGYRANSTLAGSRLDTQLKDTAASIDVLTMALIEDVAAVNLDEVLEYATNADNNIAAGESSDNLQFEAPSGRFNIRGLPATRTRNYLPISHNADVYNATRFEEQRGPNSILYGIGSPAGIINKATKRATLGTDLRRGSFMLVDAGGFRATVDVNQPLGEKMAVRVNTVYSALDDPIAEYAFRKTEGLHLAFTGQINEKIRVFAETEWVNQDSVLPTRRLPRDGVSNWIYNPTNPGVTFSDVGELDGELGDFGIRQLGGATRGTYIANDGSVVNMSRGYYTSGNSLTIYGENYPELWDRRANPGGAAQLRANEFYSFGAGVEMALTQKTFLELSFNRNGLETQTGGLSFGDVYGMPAELNPDGSENPYAGMMYVEGQYRFWDRATDYESYRATLSHEVDFERLGNYRFALMYETNKEALENMQRRERWVDQDGLPAFNSNIRNSRNTVYRRVYFDPLDPAGIDWSSVYATGPLAEGFVDDADFGDGNLYDSAWRNQSAFIHTWNDYETAMLGLQARYFDNRLIIGGGLREDTMDQASGNFRDENNRIVENEFRERWWDPEGEPTLAQYEGTTKTFGAVFHINEVLRLMYNHSDNFGVSARRRFTYPDNGPQDNTEGIGTDFGIGFSLLEDKVSGRLTRFETDATNAIEFGFNLANLNDSIWEVLVANPDVTGLSQADYDNNLVIGTGGTTDKTVEGYEFAITANPTRNFRLNLRYSYTDGFRSNSYPDAHLYRDGDAEGLFYGRQALPYFESLIAANPSVGALTASPGEEGGSTLAAIIADFRDDLAVQDRIDGVSLAGNTLHKGNIFANYSFREGRLKGLSVGAGVRYVGPRDLGLGEDAEGNLFKLEGSSVTSADVKVGYRLGDFAGLSNVRLQLNVKNALNNQDPLINRKNSDGSVRSVTFARPRAIRLTSTFDF